MEIERYFDEIESLWPESGRSPSNEVLDLCKAAVAEHPESSALWYDLGVLMHRCGDKAGYTREDYLRCFESAVRCDSRNWEAHQELGYVLDVFFDEYGRAEQAFRAAIELGAGRESYYGLARVLAQMGKIDDAIHSLSQGVCPFHDDQELQNLRAEILGGDWYWDPSGSSGDA